MGDTREMDWRTARAAEDRQPTDVIIQGIRADLVPRAEIGQQLSDIKERIDRLEKTKPGP